MNRDQNPIFIFLFSIVFSSFPGFVEVAGVTGPSTPMTGLSKHIMEQYPNDGADVAPENSTVRLTLHIYSVFGLDENEVMELNGWVDCNWRDRRLTWNPQRWANITEIYLSASKVWTPDIGFVNSKQIDTKDFSSKKDLRVEILSTGDIYLYGYFISETPCPIQTFLFPFDKQSCPLEIGSYYSRGIRTVVENVYFKSVEQNTVGEWIPTGYSITKFSHPHYVNPGEHLKNDIINIILKRKPLYHIVLVLIPYCLTSVMANLLFILKPPNERLRVSLSVLLSMTVFVLIVSRQAPKSMRGPSLLGMFLLGQMLFLVLLTFVAVLGPLLFPKREARSKDVEAEDRALEGDDAYRILGRKFAGWSAKQDRICLVIHVIASCLNGIICLFVIPFVVN